MTGLKPWAKKAGLHWWRLDEMGRASTEVGCFFFHQFDVSVIWVFPKIVVPQNGWFTMETPIKMDDLGGKPTIFRKHPYGPKKCRETA